MCKFLQRRILGCHRSWRNARPNCGLLRPHCRNRKSHMLVTFILKNDSYHIMCGMAADLTTVVADESGENLEDQHVMRQLEAGKRVLTEVMREKNNLQDANIKLNVELKDVRGQLADSEKENKQLRRDIFSKCLKESF